MGAFDPIEEARRRLFLYAHAQRSFIEARKGCELILKIGGDTEDEIPGMRTLVAGVVLSYARPFGDGKYGYGKLPGSFEKFDNPREKFMHDEILGARNRFYAHVAKGWQADIPNRTEEFFFKKVGPEVTFVLQEVSFNGPKNAKAIAALCDVGIKRAIAALEQQLRVLCDFPIPEDVFHVISHEPGSGRAVPRPGQVFTGTFHRFFE